MEQKIFESKVEVIKYKVLRELARQTWAGVDAFNAFDSVAKSTIKKEEPPMSCCIYKDRAILAEKMRIGLGDFHGQRGTVHVVPIACDECPKSGHMITDLCRGCVAHFCKEVCPTGAISIDAKGYAHINKETCVDCGRCAAACKYSAITNRRRPCERACPTGAISMSETGEAEINHDKCIVCGACIYECPFGATNDLSNIVQVIHDIQNKSEERKVYAIIAPAIATQYPNCTTGQVITALKEVGFDEVVEVASGADAVALQEAEELLEKGFLTSSCCPAFTEYVDIEFPELKSKVSTTPSPMVITGKMIKAKDPNAVVVFIGPCIAKKYERRMEKTGKVIDSVLTFAELLSLVHSKDIEIKTLPETEINQASGFGRGFAQTGGLAAAVKQALKELGREDFELKPIVCNGIAECKAALLKAKAGKLDANFIEGMACVGGCAGGNGTLINKKNTPGVMKKYMESSTKKTMK